MIEIPQAVVNQIPEIAEKIRKAFKKEIKTPKFLGFVSIGADRKVGVMAEEVFRIGRKSKKTVAIYNHALDVIFVYRSILNSIHGPIGVEHFLAHEIAHAVDRKRMTTHKKYQKMTGQRFVDSYACQETEFDAEMAAINYIDMPYIKKNYATLVVTYLNTISGYVGCWTRNKKLSKLFVERLEKMLHD